MEKSRLQSADVSLEESCFTGYKPTEEQEYETQFFGFTPKSFCDGIYNAMQDYSIDCLNAAQEYLSSEFSTVFKEGELNKGREALLAACIKVLDRAIDKAESYITSNIFYIPNYVVLREDQIHEKYRDFTKVDDMELDRDIGQLKEKIKAVKYSNACLRHEKKDIAQVLQAHDRLLELLTEQNRTIKEAGVSDTNESLIFIKDKASRLGGLLRRIQASECLQKRCLPNEDVETAVKKVKPETDNNEEDTSVTTSR